LKKISTITTGDLTRNVIFILPNEQQTLQVCAQLHDQNKERELKELQEALKTLHRHQGRILTLDQEGQLTRNNIQVTIQPVW